MRCDWQNDPNAPVPCHVVDLDTGQVLSLCALADEETGEYVRYVTDSQGGFVIDPGTMRVQVETGKARIEIRQGRAP